jgi:replicative DNA helicase
VINDLRKTDEDLVLSILAQHPDRYASQLNGIAAEMFSPMNRPIFREIAASIDAQVPPDLISITAKLRADGILEDIGGAYRLTEVFTLFASPAIFKEALNRLRMRSEMERKAEAYKIAAEIYSKAVTLPVDSTAELILEAEKAIENAGKVVGKPLESKNLSELCADLVEQIQERIERGSKLPGISTGFQMIDDKTGGMQPGRVWVVAGKPGDGKSTLIQNFCEAAMAQGKSVRIYPLEMTQLEQAYRILCSDSGLDNQVVMRGMMTKGDYDAFGLSMARLAKMKATIVDTHGASAKDILADVEQSDCDVALVDYIQLMEADGPAKGSREEIVAGISRMIKRTAVRSGKCILTASQLNDAGQLRESRAIGQDADHIIQLDKTEGDDSVRTAKCLKNRTGERFWDCPLRFIGKSYKFLQAESVENEQTRNRQKK